ncbi:hypothetical protein MRX96_046119 [Rhipicephalus microplus]
MTAWKKEEIQEWLTSKNIIYSKRMIKKQVLELVASVKSRNLSYIVDDAPVRAGCIVLRLPSYNCEFNTSELVWTGGQKWFHCGQQRLQAVQD